MRRILRVLSLLGCLSSGAVQAQELGGLAQFLEGSVRDSRVGAEVHLKVSQGVPWRVFTLTDPDRLVVDFREVDWQGADPAALRQSEKVTALRIGGFRPGWSRLVAVLALPMPLQQAGLTVDAETGAAELLLRLGAADRAAFDARAGAPQDPRWDLPPASAVRPVPQGAGPVVVMIDPGHGGIDPGAEAGSASEADLMLTFARELREVLLRAGGFEVAMTRDTDSFISLEGRVALAHAAGADVFVSLHADSIDEGIARGAAVYTLAEDASDAASAALAERHDRDDLLAGVDLSGADDRVANVLLDLARLDNTPRSQAMAQHLLDGIRNAVGRVHKRPLRQAGFSVLKAADIPSALIELGFLSTAGELANLQDPAWRAGMAAGIRDGLQAWALEDAALARLRRQ
ncbi:N-acetylmuramoyl-L-alanine amidase [Puniceibacterium confluentis]|uniref:N-acetylmuramoyl-L-alanine amidase n=2 Tax=Puniceibacterium confluentis TaxID=1958944 RepID=UPI0011B7CE9E|nr:N-acetylmuramoyl-L-alanine amidase [Puniceibacterium confluentis]